MLDVCYNFPISTEEFQELEDKFTKLCWHAAHELKKKNSRNNFTDEAEDIHQNLIIDLMRAGSYTKRQRYIEKCLAVSKRYAQDDFMKAIINELENLWNNRTRHGANRQKYGKFQEQLLEQIVKQVVPKNERPDKKEPLKIDSKFSTYCKAIVWNGQKSMGKKITREKIIRSGMVSLSEFSHLS